MAVVEQMKPRIEMDGVQLRHVQRRFMVINQDRLKRVYAGLRDRHRLFLDLLPLLFHINHPMLPGYLSSKAPAGLSDYKPNKRTLDAARKLSKSFTYQQRSVREHDVLALYMMGSSGTIAYSRKSDFDIWVCIRHDMDRDAREMLAQKAANIESWAASMSLEVHFFLMDDVAFRAGEMDSLSSESSGSAQHHLLLDEFYRTGLLIAGRYPIWWLVPPQYEVVYDDYVSQLLHKRFVNPKEVVDFGGLGEMPAGEFFGATLWQLYKAVSSPYKSVLKILLMEAYSDEYPHIRMLSHRFKEAVYGGETNLDGLDPYVQMCRRVEEYLLENGELERLELARRCFYFKINEKMSRPDRRGNISWRREVMRELVQEWGWSDGHLQLLDTRPQWKIQQVLEERQILVDALRQSYQALSEFARGQDDDHTIDPAELNLLGRRLYAAFERKAGKVDLVNPGISDDLSEDRLSLHQLNHPGQSGWVLYRGLVRSGETGGQRPLKRGHSLVEILAWCHFNHITQSSLSMISLHPEDCTVSSWEQRSVMDCLEDIFPRGRLAEPDLDALAEPARVARNALFINLGVDPMAKLTREGMQLVSSRTDALSYGGRWENLAINFELIIQTSWQEILTFHYSGDHALLDCLCDYLAWTPIDAGGPPPMGVNTFSFSSTRGAPIANRIRDVFDQVTAWFYRGAERGNARYLLQVSHDYYLLQPENGVPRYRHFKTYAALLQELAAPQERFSPLGIDPSTLSDTPLPALFQANKPGRLQLFYQVDGPNAHVYVLDEKGSLFHQEVAFHDALTLLTQFQRFLNKIQERMNFLVQEAGKGEFNVAAIDYYQIHHRHGAEPRLEKQNISPFKQSRSYFGVQVIGDVMDNNRSVFTMYCNEQEFSTLEYGERLFEEVARYILSKRASGQSYPIYITDIDLARNLLGVDTAQELQTIHFLNYKKRIEQRLNDALAKL
ncbi:adenylate cyclase [Thiohalobacter thiocyanaticus]|uniref:Adenylate cyclase n=1 Tax=Thiohalobacter thiocyanaticus TaxID=585455 RepID=A0A1Z4VM76_9GAMM|nr:class I adenylate cyclase [Thiohalobacter thiocyanaticus]BAZ92720.1 adenylate cyclase [Thiohalobacter thiocyanaticus]